MLFPGRNEPADNLGLYWKDLCICPGIVHLRHKILDPRRRQSWIGALCTQSVLGHRPLWLQPTCSSWNCCLPLHHGLPRSDGGQLWRWKEGVENYPEGDPLALPPAKRPCCPRPWGQPRFPQVCRSRGELQVGILGTLWTIFLLRYNLKNFFLDVGPTGMNIKGPLWRPVRLVTNIIAFTFTVLVPVLYGIIFRSPRIIWSSSLFVAPSQRM